MEIDIPSLFMKKIIFADAVGKLVKIASYLPCIVKTLILILCFQVESKVGHGLFDTLIFYQGHIDMAPYMVRYVVALFGRT